MINDPNNLSLIIENIINLINTFIPNEEKNNLTH